MLKPYHERAEYAWTKDSVRLILTPSTFAKTSLFFVQEIGHFEALHNYFTERKNLESFLIVYTCTGQGELIYKKKKHSVQSGQFFFIDCMNYQHYRTISEEPWDFYWVHINGFQLNGYYEQFKLGINPLRSVPLKCEIPRIMKELLHLHSFKSSKGELIASKLIVELLTEILIIEPENDFTCVEPPSFIAATQEYIQFKYSSKLSLDCLAKNASVSKYHLAKEFKRHTGFSPGEYIINTRISSAKELLTYSDLSVSEISEKVGIENVSHFINLFKERAECTPLLYRKKWKSLH